MNKKSCETVAKQIKEAEINSQDVANEPCAKILNFFINLLVSCKNLHIYVLEQMNIIEILNI